MAVTFTAKPNPVGIWPPATKGTTHIQWDTGNNAINGRVSLVKDGVAQSDPAVATGRTGQFDPQIVLGSTYVFTLRGAVNGALLGTLIVTAEDLQQTMIQQTVASMSLFNRINPAQSIRNLLVSPSVDTVHISFRTVKPTIPLVTIEMLDGTQLIAWFPLLGGLQTHHAATLGTANPLPQGTNLRLTIRVPGSKPLVGKAKDVVRSVIFKTGTRLVDVLFDTIEVRTDGDPGIKGAGEFRFHFAAGDASTNFDFLAPTFERDISAGDPPVIVDSNIPLIAGPRNVYVRVMAYERDTGIPSPGQGLNMVGTFGDRRVGTGGRETAFSNEAWVADVFDVGGVSVGVTTIPMVLNTGDFTVAYKVNGRIMTFVRSGQGVFTVPIELKPGLMTTTVLGTAGKGFVSGGAAGGAGTLVASGEDGAIWQKPVDPNHPSSRHDGWELAASAPGGPVSAAFTRDGTLQLVALDAEGVALRWNPPAGRRKGEWQSLGGSFVASLALVSDRRNRAEIFGVDREGRLLHQVIGDANRKSNWQVIGAGIAGELIALTVPDAGLGLFAIDRSGNVVHVLRRAGERFGARGAIWRRLGGPKAGWLHAQLIDGIGVVVSVLTEDRVLHILQWRKYPDERGGRAWKEYGAFDELERTVALTASDDRGQPLRRPDTRKR